jgi:endoglucanase
VKTDVLGNTFGYVGEEEQPTVMLAGHCDEIGFMVTYIDDNG